MQFLDEQYNTISDVARLEDKLFWLYDIDKKDSTGSPAPDFYLRRYYTWENIVCEAYILAIDNDVFKIPASYHIVIGDYDGGLDIIRPEEITGRHFEVLTFHRTLTEESWLLEPVEIIGYESEHNFVVPFTHHLTPIAISAKKSILVAQKDMYNKIKHLNFGDIV